MLRALVIAFVGSVIFASPGQAAELGIDFSKKLGTIRPLHGINLGPLCSRGLVDLSAYHAELGVPLTRLHDVVWAGYDAVDVSTLFRDFRDDPGQPENYDFAATDDYLTAIAKAGSPILYRLGESIEHTPRKYRVNPPPDFEKWAEVACSIVRHCNEGWAGGVRRNIRYWEIWNEPDVKPAMWTGTDEQFLELYETTAIKIKRRWPELKVGGPGLGNIGSFERDEFKPSPYLVRFLKHCRERRVPMDFFSWHCYTKDPSEYGRRARAVRKLLDAGGFQKTESHLNEWNYLPAGDWRPITREGQGAAREQWLCEMSGPTGAAFAAWVLMSLQDEPVDMANFYTAVNQPFGMFTFNGVPLKNFYAFKAFRALLETPERVKTPPAKFGQIALCAGLNAARTRAAVLLSSVDGELSELVLGGFPWNVPTRFELSVVDATHNLEKIRTGNLPSNGRLTLTDLKPPTVILVELSPSP